MKTKKTTDLEPDVPISRTQHLIRLNNKVDPGLFLGPESHFCVDHNTAEALLQACWAYTLQNDPSNFISRVDSLKGNLLYTNAILSKK